MSSAKEPSRRLTVNKSVRDMFCSARQKAKRKGSRICVVWALFFRFVDSALTGEKSWDPTEIPGNLHPPRYCVDDLCRPFMAHFT